MVTFTRTFQDEFRFFVRETRLLILGLEKLEELLASQSIPTWNRIVCWLKEMEIPAP
jgi:hypothetical protein